MNSMNFWYVMSWKYTEYLNAYCNNCTRIGINNNYDQVCGDILNLTFHVIYFVLSCQLKLIVNFPCSVCAPCRLSSVVNDCPTAASSPIVRVSANNSSGGGGSNRGRSSPVSFLSSISSSISNSSLGGAGAGGGGGGGGSAGGGGVGAASAMTTQWVWLFLLGSNQSGRCMEKLMKGLPIGCAGLYIIGGWCPFRLSPLQNEPGTVAAAARSQHACRRELVLYPGSSSV